MSSETTADTVPYARFRETIEKLREAEARIANLEGEVKSAGTAAQRAAALEAELTAAKQAAEQTATRFDRWKALTSTGITHPDLASAIEAEYERIQPGEGGKRPDLVELVSAWKSKPDELVVRQATTQPGRTRCDGPQHHGSDTARAALGMA